MSSTERARPQGAAQDVSAVGSEKGGVSRDLAVCIEGVGKRYTKLDEHAMLLRSILPLRRPVRSDLWALRDIDIKVGRGETVGVIGRNGAGKTTLLRMLAGVTRPTEGRVEVSGRIAPLISVGVGFHREMSGRENVYVNAMLLGLTRREIEERFDQIVAFAELEEFIDTPVKFYSSGMYVRLGFSVAIHVDPDVLLVDEVLAVGDMAFQLKCFDRMRDIQAQGTTIVLVSHSMHAIRLLCPRAILLRDGRVEFDGKAENALARHHQLLSVRPDAAGGDGHLQNAPVYVVERRLEGPDGPTFHPGYGQPVTYRAKLRFDQPLDSPQLIFQVVTQVGTLAYAKRTFAGTWRQFAAGEVAEVAVPFTLRLAGGTYRLVLIVTDKDGRERLYEDPPGLLVYVAPRPGTRGVADLEGIVTVDGEALNNYGDLLLSSPTDQAVTEP